MNKRTYCKPEFKELHIPFKCNLLLNLSLEGDQIGYEGDELVDDFAPELP